VNFNGPSPASTFVHPDVSASAVTIGARAKAFVRTLLRAWRDPAGKQARLIVLVGANLLALITAFTMLIVNHFGDTADHNAAIRAEQVAKAASSQLHLALTMVDQGLQRTERRVVEAEGRPTFARLKSAHQFPEQLKVNLAVVNGEGQLFMTLRSPEGIEPFDVRDREYVRPHFEGNVEGTYVGRPIVERRSGVWSIPLSRTLRADDGRCMASAWARPTSSTSSRPMAPFWCAGRAAASIPWRPSTDRPPTCRASSPATSTSRAGRCMSRSA
jgi:hypothetical protein